MELFVIVAIVVAVGLLWSMNNRSKQTAAIEAARFVAEQREREDRRAARDIEERNQKQPDAAGMPDLSWRKRFQGAMDAKQYEAAFEAVGNAAIQLSLQLCEHTAKVATLLKSSDRDPSAVFTTSLAAIRWTMEVHRTWVCIDMIASAMKGCPRLPPEVFPTYDEVEAQIQQQIRLLGTQACDSNGTAAMEALRAMPDTLRRGHAVLTGPNQLEEDQEEIRKVRLELAAQVRGLLCLPILFNL